MNKEITKALEGSIDKWQKIADYLRYKRQVDYDKLYSLERGAENCPLCLLMRIEFGGACEWCPVTAKAGKFGCGDTPYTDFKDAISCRLPPKALRHYAKAELEFLKSLRD